MRRRKRRLNVERSPNPASKAIAEIGSPDVRRLKELQPRALYTVARREVSCKVDPPKDSEKVGMRQAVEILAAILEARAALAA